MDEATRATPTADRTAQAQGQAQAHGQVHTPAPDSGRDSTVDGVLRRSARRTPDRPALHYRDRTWSYAALDDAVSRAAAVLRATGLRPGDRVAAYGHNSDAYLIGFLAAARAGLVHVPVNHQLTGADLTYLLEQSGSGLVLTDPALADRLPDGTRTLPLRDSDDSLLAALATTEPFTGPGPAAEDLVQLLYTSGTTALPKGAMMTHRALLHAYMSAIHALDLRATDRPVHALPLYHSAQTHVFLLPYLAVGAENRLIDRPDADTILDLVESGHADSLFAPPTVWVALSARPDFATRDLGGLRKAYYGASVMPVPVLERLRARLPGLAFYNCFGQSEIGPLATVLGPDEHEGRMDSCGRPVLFVEARVVDEDGRDVPDGTPGEVVYRSPQLCEGYWGKPEETAEAFRDGWFRSGDLAVRDDEGRLTVVDRVKDVINSGGVLIASRQVEDALYLHPAVADAAVIGLPDARWIEAVTAVVVRHPGSEVTEDELLAHAKDALPAFKAPKRVVFTDTLPRNASGKVLKRELRDLYGA
ncbi:fatty acyl-CoA synthetase [Streptomyces uncialis]|uniref:fatty acyl-CoA synthetase n=1 Tax=Streptomyces uncialis TaxID=1048205 RepID=UPI0009A12876|nr:fatty acyl-CoA synthetase [Streptomyces uncialis]